tara:strand:- start:126 stop:1457 length:1332 start_codon:yes stop_codon:yes gene_type:complete
MDISDSEILILVGKIVGESNVKMESKTKIKVIVDDRVSVRSEVFEDLKSKLGNDKVKIEPHRVSSVDPIFVQKSARDKILIYFKSKSGGGSGLGAEFTKQVEGGQAVYAAVAFNKGSTITSADVTPESINDAKNLFSIDDSVENILKMSDPWVQSSVKGANLLYKKFGDLKSKGVVFHRGDKVVNHIENQFKRIKKLEGVRIDINKWSPADIYVTTKDYDPKCLEEEMSLKGLNQCMMDRLINKTMFGVSLKQIKGSAKISKLNVDSKDGIEKEFSGFEMTQDSADCYMLFKESTKIQFRGFDGPKALTGFQGEVKGSAANQGKIGMGSVNLIFKLHGIRQLPKDYPAKIKNGAKKLQVANFVESGVKKYAKSFNSKKYGDMIIGKQKKGEDVGYFYQKALCVDLISIINAISSTKLKNQVCNDLLLYASSQSIISGPYFKLE